MPITICSVYLHQNDLVTISSLQSLITQLPGPYIVTGDFNTHNPIWGSSVADNRGKTIESFLATSSSALLNTGLNTRFDVYSGNFSAIDLTLCSPLLLSRLTWTVCENSYTSDHFPQFMSLMSPNSETPVLSPKWRFEKANWTAFAEKIDLSSIAEYETADQMAMEIEKAVLSAAEDTIPLSGGKPHKRSVPWWNEKCAIAIRNKRNSWRKYKRHYTDENLVEFKIARAKARHILYQSKRQSWQSFVSSINSSTPPAILWNRIRSLTQKRHYEPIPALQSNTGHIYTSTEDIAEGFAEFYYECTKSAHAAPPIIPSDAENPEEDQLDLIENMINQEITIQEVIKAVRSLKNTAPGPDRIHSIMLKHLQYHHLEHLTRFFNHIWQKRDFPTQWRLSLIHI